MTIDHNYSTIPTSGTIDPQGSWPKKHVLPQGKNGSLSVGGWTVDNEGFIQQTFLGASITNFNLNAGFGDTSSSLSCQLVNDEYNRSDGYKVGIGDDPYHNGKFDMFAPPVVGSPVFFKFGKNPATVEQAFRKTFDDLYNIKTLADFQDFPESSYSEPLEEVEPYHYVDLDRKVVIDKSRLWDLGTLDRGRNHFAFGGILQSYTQNKGAGGSPLFSVNVVDPREILSNAMLIFNNYQGTTYNNKNLFNIYGFLEYDPSDDLKGDLDARALGKGIVKRVLNPDGTSIYAGFEDPDLSSPPPASLHLGRQDANGLPILTNLLDQYYIDDVLFPVTGQGFSRRSSRGMPFYRISQAIRTLFEYDGPMPEEYTKAGFGGGVNFRGFNYVVDFSGIPTDLIPLGYFVDFDQLDMLSFAQELCDIISHELYVTLLPIIDHPACSYLYGRNNILARDGNTSAMVAGIIRIDAIDKTRQPKYGAIKEYLDGLENRGIHVENQDVGFELSNVTTDKFVVGAQKVDMVFLTGNKDRDDLQQRRNEAGLSNKVEQLQKDQWSLETSLKQQFLPFYGFLGDNKAVTIPKGFSSYQQILLDSSNLNAYGVGNYYVATEMELRAALVSFERWKEFLLSYNETYIQDVAQYGATYAAAANANPEINKALRDWKSTLGLSTGDELDLAVAGFEERKFAVAVPRSVWNSDKPYMGSDGYPASPCNPPYGYPLYYKRAQKIGIPEAGVVQIQNSVTKLITNYQSLNSSTGRPDQFSVIPKDDIRERIEHYEMALMEMRESWLAANPKEEEKDGYRDTPRFKTLALAIKKARDFQEDYAGIVKNLENAKSNRLAATKNALGLVDGDGKPKDTPITRMIANLPKTAKNHLDNAKKVYNFVKKVAEENLGKKYLVKIPKACNTRWQPNIVHWNDGTYNEAAGPFGFRPEPINSDFGFKLSLVGNRKSQPADAFTTYLNYRILDHNNRRTGHATETNYSNAYTYGALKCNFNPFEEQWNYNYKPEPQGGFFDFTLIGGNLLSRTQANTLPANKLPQGARQGLFPIDTEAIVEDSNRVKCYARYDNSHFLDFTNVPTDDFTQQTLDKAGNFIPDVIETQPNVRPDKRMAFDKIQSTMTDNQLLDRQPPSMAFVKCQLDESFYLPPKLQRRSLNVWATEYDLHLGEPSFDIVEAEDPDTGCPAFQFKLRRLQPIFSVAEGGGKGGSVNHCDFLRRADGIVHTELRDLDSDHVYAIITVPGRIQSTVDQRWASGPMKAYNTVQIENILTADVVKHPDFNKPAFPELQDEVVVCQTKEEEYPGGFNTFEEAYAAGSPRGQVGAFFEDGKWWPGEASDYVEFTFENLNEMERVQRAAVKGIALSSPEGGLSFIQPSPVYPSMVAIPLMSEERCYGPWLSMASLTTANPRERYTNIGGKIEFIKDEKLAPWNFAGYQLLNEAGSLQADFSNSLLLFSERGGFVMPDAPTGIAIATALKKEGPLITSISVDVGSEGVKTTVKMDLYTAQYGKLQKQKEGAIAKIARDRQKIIDQTNDAARKGFGKGQSNKNLVASLLANGGQQILDLVKGNDQFFTDAQKGKNPRTLFVLDDVGGQMISEDSIKESMEQYPDELLRQKALEDKAIAGPENFLQGVSAQDNHPNMASVEYSNPRAKQESIMPHQGRNA